VGQGSATILRNGARTPPNGTFRRIGRNDYTLNGQQLPLNPGRTWIILEPS